MAESLIEIEQNSSSSRDRRLYLKLRFAMSLDIKYTPSYKKTIILPELQFS